MVWVDYSGMMSIIKEELYYPLSDNINDITRCHCVCLHVSVCVWHSYTLTHSLYFRTSQTVLSSTCLQCYLPQSLPGSQIPTVSAHVNSKITGHAHTHICFAFKRVISVCTQPIPSYPLLLFFFFLDKPRKQSRWGSKTQQRHEERRCGEMMDTHWWVV